MEETRRAPDLVALLESLPDAVLFLDLGSRLIWANRSAEDLFGWRLEESVGVEGLSLVHPDDLEMAVISLAGMQVERVGLPLELRVRTATGWRQVELIASSTNGGLLLTIRDLTNRRRWELAGDSTEMFRSVLQHLDSIVMVVEESGAVRRVSASMTRMLGIDQLQVEGRPLSSLVVVSQRAAVDDALRGLTSAESGSKLVIDVDAFRADHSIQPVVMSIVNLLEDPTVGGFVVTLTDISQRAEAERRLREANAVLAATLDSVSDGILTVDRNGAVRSWNRPYLDIWAMSDQHVEGSTLRTLVEHMASLARDPDQARTFVLEAEGDGTRAHSLTIDLADGRAIECRSLPQHVEGVASGWVWSFRDVTAARQLERDLLHRALHDPLTGLANQVLFRRRVESAVEQMGSGARFAVVFVDLDDFKAVNDSLGHSAGDLLLVEVAHRLRSVVRDVDTVARLGGDEFAMLLMDIEDDAAAIDIVRRLQERLGQPVELLGQPVVPTASIGVAASGQGAGIDSLMRDADVAMYHAKRSGRNRYRLFTPDLGAGTVHRSSVDPTLRGAAARGELVVHYQPIVDPNRCGEIVALEALVRWQHPERGLVMPGDFIAYAESSGLIDEIGLHVLELACRDVRDWRERFGVLAPMVSVNLSPHQVLDERLPDRVVEVIQRTGADSSRLVLEFTEGALMQEPAMVARQLRHIRSSGVRLAIDDFGQGHSSLARLQQFPIDSLKIDRSFVQRVEDRTGWSLVLAVVELAHALEMLTVAEGVETTRQQSLLNELGADLAQGYLHYRPMGADAVTELLSARSRSTAQLR